MNLLTVILLILLVLKVTIFYILELLNLRFLNRHSEEAPESVEGIMDDETFKKSINYTKVKTKFSCINTFYDSIILASIIVFSLIPWLYGFLTKILGYGLFGQSIAFILFIFILGIPSLPFSWWNTFKIEEEFGFNKNTLSLWISDQLKAVLLSLIIGVPLLMILMWIVSQMGTYWWVWAFIFFWAFQILLVVIYPMYILPIFNKLEPLESGELKDRLLKLGEMCGFESKTILVMDGSKRSGHSNAFFTGFGRFRRIVLYDTLINQMEIDEIEAVLAHEIGHYKCGHIPKRLMYSAFFKFYNVCFNRLDATKC